MTDGADAAPGLFLGQSFDNGADRPEHLLFHRANRHVVVAGATGTGKTVTLQIMAQGFSDAGVPVFCADVKGDLSGICVPGSPNEKLLARAASMGLTLTPKASPVVFWDLYGLKGHPIRTTVSVPDKGTILMGGQRRFSEVEIESGVPVLSKIPIVNRFFTNRIDGEQELTVVMLMRPEIVIQSENEDLLFPGLVDQLGNIGG
jgi:DNA helicase HerA-like ATPase